MSAIRRISFVLAAAALTCAAAGSATAAPRSATAGPAIAATQDLVTLHAAAQAYAGPAASSKKLDVVPALTPITSEHTTLPVLGTYGSWLLVRLPGRPNGHSGWIRDHDTTSSVTAWHIVVDTAARKVTIYHAGTSVRVVEAVVGKPSTPTPPGDYFVEESISLGPHAVGAPFALALSARSNVLQDFEGGPGRSRCTGSRTSAACRAPRPRTAASGFRTRMMRWLSGRIGPGVPVTILK